MKRGTLVCLTGLDGAGKSTLTANVVERLRADGYDAVRAYGRYLPRLTYPLILLGNRTVFADSDIETDYEGHQSAKEGVFANEILSTLYESVIVADYIPQFVHRVLYPLYRHDIVLCDRYFYDTLLSDLAGDVIDEPAGAVERYDFYSKFLPTPDHEFYVQIPPAVSMERKDDVPSIQYLEDRKRFYDHFAAEYGFSVLDGTKPVDELTQQVLDEMGLD